MARGDTPGRKDKKKTANARNRQKYRDLVNDFKDKPCLICGNQYPSVAMDLHHIDPSIKDGNISAILKSKGYEKIKQELSKCIVLCAVCHRLLHAGLIESDASQ